MRPLPHTAFSAMKGRGLFMVCPFLQAGQPRAPSRSPAHSRRAERGRIFASLPLVQDRTSGSLQYFKWKEGADIRMLYDGDCPLCMREVNMLKRRDEGKGKIDFADISADDYSAERNANVSYEQAMGEIHAILPNGSIVKNTEVFRRLYEAVGLGWVYALTKVQPIGKAADWVYSVWAKYRLPITGRPDVATILAEKKGCKIR